jgi:undecaprenyl-diphosphatase
MFKKIQRIDDKVVDNIIKYRSPWKNRIMIAASSAGNGGLIWFAFCMPFLIYGPWRLTGANIIFGLAITQFMCEVIIKHIVKRERPVWHLADDEQLIHRPKYYSFPSGHTTASFSVVAVTALRCGPWTVAFVLACAILIAFSRVYLRVHYLSDVIVGVLLGLLFGSISVALFNNFISVLVQQIT